MENILNAYRQNMFASEGRAVDVLALYKALPDKTITDSSGKTLYHLAASFFDDEAVEYLASEGVKVRADDYGNTPLHEMMWSPYLNDIKNIEKRGDAIYRTAKKLLELGVNPKKKNENDKVAYYEAGVTRMYPFIQAMADASVKMDALGDEKKNLLHKVIDMLAYNKDTERTYKVVKILLDSGSIDPEDKDVFDTTPLTYAQRNNAKEIAALLTGDESAAKTGGKNFREAVLSVDIEAMDALLETGADINEEIEQCTPLMWACYYPSAEVVKYLVGKGADINHKSGETGSTAIASLFYHGTGYMISRMKDPMKETITILRTLIDKGLDVNAFVDANGNTALNLVCGVSYGNDFGGTSNPAVEELIDAGADVNLPNKEGKTPLMSFAIAGDEHKYNLAELLLDHKADTTPVDRASNTALMYAAGNSNKQSAKKIVELLLDAGDNTMEKVNNRGETALDIAVKSENEAVVKLLLERS